MPRYVRTKVPRFKVPDETAGQLRILAPAVVIGVGAGAGAVLFRWMVMGATRLFSGHADYAAAQGAAHPLLPHLGPFFVLLAPAVAGLVYGPLVHRYAREARGHGVPEVMLAVAQNGGRIKGRVAVVKSLASALCIGGGGSVGREGPIVQIGSALGSTLGRLIHADEQRTTLLLACGAAGGIAATFNAPLAGVVFAMELILRRWTARTFGILAIASVTACALARAVFGNEVFLPLPGLSVQHPDQYALFAVLGLVAGAVGIVFTRFLYAVEDLCDRIWRGPEWLRPAVGGLALGALLLVLPQMYGVGYPVLEDAAHGKYALGLLLLLLAGKMVATSLTMGIGGSGGVFAPSLFIGAMLGAVFGIAASALFPGHAAAPAAFAMVGMAAVFTGSARAPIVAVVIMLELTGAYGLLMPLLLAVALSAGVSRLLSRETVYTLKLTRRGIDLSRPAGATA
ncbi:chloride channel protein [Streptomyces sp. TRM66268-LWL]|uniref:Chloride channel protein n=1 Tax=Streptomyces polyasparticus TaxID=2767826 RepID=A0ABR7SCM2_9ACTN|nr:chloride channel protein [Streptomyces polyasparticus]